MPNTPLRLNAGTLATNCYPADPQTLYNEMFELGSALLGDITGILIQDAVPDANDRDKGWIRTDSGEPLYGNRVAIWFNGHWVIRHDIPPGSDVRWLWVGNTTDLITFDGGDSNTPGPASGPMWEIDADYTDRIPIGAGTTAAVGVNAGASSVTLSSANLPQHNHEIGVPVSDTESTSDTGVLGGGDNIDWNNSDTTNKVGLTRNTGSASPTALSIIPPVRGIYLIKRTALREYFVVA